MSREQNVAAVEAYLDCFETKDLSKVPLAENVTFEGPLVGTLTGRQMLRVSWQVSCRWSKASM